MRLISIGAAARAHLFDIQTVEGNLYYWSDRALNNVPAIITADGNPAQVNYQPWILQPPTWSFHRSMQTDTGTFSVQNLSGDTMARDFERVLRKSAMEGALFVYRFWNSAAEVADREVHGTLTVTEVNNKSASINCTQLFTGQDNVPGNIYGEICNLTWGQARCGATGATECLYSFATCQVQERFMATQATFMPDFSEGIPDMPSQPVNRRRTI